MYKKHVRVGGVVLLLAVMLAVGCAGAPSAEEVAPDLDAIKTQAVQTAMAQMTAAAQMMPTEDTEEEPTLTPLPTLTPQTAGQVGAVPTTSIQSSGGGGGGGTAIPTWTPVVYGCQVVNQIPVDGWQYTGSNIDVKWQLKNVGSATWKAGVYYWKWSGYADLSPQHTYVLSKDVGPYETVWVSVDVDVPTTPGQYRTQWYLVNDNGQSFCGFYYYVSAIPWPTATP